MKKIYLIALIAFLSINANAQSWGHLYNYWDTCYFDVECDFIELDTNVSNIWQKGEPQKLVFNSALTENAALMTDTINTYPTNAFSSFVINLDHVVSSGYNFVLRFTHKYDTDTLIDGGMIEVSLDSQQTWINALDDTSQYYHTWGMPGSNMFNLYGHSDSLVGGYRGFSGSSNGWINSEIAFDWFTAIKRDLTDNFAIRFTFVSDSIDTGKDGWMIDNMDIHYFEIPGSTNNKYQDLLKVDVYPNPAKDLTTISIDAEITDDIALSVFNVLGQKIASKQNVNTNKISLNTSEWARGMCFIQLHDKTKILARKKLILE